MGENVFCSERTYTTITGEFSRWREIFPPPFSFRRRRWAIYRKTLCSQGLKSLVIEIKVFS